MKSESMDSVFHALSHADRRRILDIVKASPGISVGDVCVAFRVSRIAVIKQLRVLEAAELLTSEKLGRTRKLYVNHVPIQMMHDRWVSGFIEFWAEKALDIKYRVESRADRASAAREIDPTPVDKVDTKRDASTRAYNKKGKRHGTD